MQKQTETGRSMIEILAVLFIMAVLSVVGVSGFQTAMNKKNANAVIHDAHLAYTVGFNILPLSGWQPVKGFTSESGKTISILMDADNELYVKAEDVEKDVCKQILFHEGESRLFFYMGTQNEEGIFYSPLLTCEETNDIIFAFNGLNFPGKNCSSTEDCPENQYCNVNEGVCSVCPSGYQLDPTETFCITDCGEQLSCLLEGNFWCCPGKNDICGSVVGSCEESSGSCKWSVAPSTSIKKESNCKAEISETLPVGASNCSASISADGTSVIVEGCGSKQYCALQYETATCEKTASGNATTVYGSCHYLGASNTGCPMNIKDSMVSVQGCGADQYCALQYETATCEKTASGNATTVYGSCHYLGASNTGCPPQQVETLMKEEVGCPIGQYCYLKWDETCSTASGDAEIVYGACLPRTTNSGQCKIPEEWNE